MLSPNVQTLFAYVSSDVCYIIHFVVLCHLIMMEFLVNTLDCQSDGIFYSVCFFVFFSCLHRRLYNENVFLLDMNDSKYMILFVFNMSGASFPNNMVELAHTYIHLYTLS